ncbi:hypothetical protein Tdes44962_MAKER10208 [Teratosphaeria destructans]|uniref:Uncharacterized protein n=1 Tax=Teratosphaeria destructans TaxID=418781 RepID=A0A9W7W0B5_9PEZI|nr:hypothetical protein Tdes44962_MAKER10208 [Teratosphaeria destructans]
MSTLASLARLTPCVVDIRVHVLKYQTPESRPRNHASMASCPTTPLPLQSLIKDAYFPPATARSDSPNAAIIPSPKAPARIGHGNVCGDLHLLVPGGGVDDLLHVSHPLALSDIEHIGSKHLWRLSELLHALLARGPSRRPTAERDLLARHDSWKLVDMLLRQRFEGYEAEPPEDAGFRQDEAGEGTKHLSAGSMALCHGTDHHHRAAHVLRSLPQAPVLRMRKKAHLQQLRDRSEIETGRLTPYEICEADLALEQRMRILSALEDERLAKLVFDIDVRRGAPSPSPLQLQPSPLQLHGSPTKLQRSISDRLSGHGSQAALASYEARHSTTRLSRTLSRSLPTKRSKGHDDQPRQTRSFDLIKLPIGDKLLKHKKDSPPPVPPKDPWYLEKVERHGGEQDHAVAELE